MPKSEPLHLAIIPDGNRRWARSFALHPWKGHEKAIENFRGITQWCRDDPRIGTLTVWCFSTENWKRDPQEVSQLMHLLEEYLTQERRGFMEKKTRFLHSGRKDRIPSSLSQLIESVETETTNQREFTLHLAVDYGGKDEILRACEKVRERDHITEEQFRQHLDHPELPDLDLIIRTADEKRTSNFFLWQSTYAEWIFSSKLFPDFTTKDLQEAVEEFEKRTRRFGK
ncbi:di-trans,poly-cis-decaprenylcistransferase [Candidatus Peribacteria bacterium RIFCSPHIGHO2_01_FULL_51_9]|nr:MAG: di-trans,poly-cis-decaprenylcistransferase [Candidatus Peribacteria bacterium RIFCSPHIGHO2_01_FULL_51_9]